MAQAFPGGATWPSAAATAPLARRAAARLVDLGVALLMLVAVVLAFTAVGTLRAAGTGEDRLDTVGIVLVSVCLTFLLYLVYEVILVGLWGRTLGKAALGLRVECLADGGRPGLPRSMLRNLIPAVTLVVFFPAYPLAWVVQSVGRQGSANDRLAGTRVVTSARRTA